MDITGRMCSRSGQHLGQVYPSADGTHMAPAPRFTVLSLTGLKTKDTESSCWGRGNVTSAELCASSSSQDPHTGSVFRSASVLSLSDLSNQSCSNGASCPHTSHPTPWDVEKMCQVPSPKTSHSKLFRRTCCPVKADILLGKCPAEHGQCLDLDSPLLGYQA